MNLRRYFTIKRGWDATLLMLSLACTAAAWADGQPGADADQARDQLWQTVQRVFDHAVAPATPPLQGAAALLGEDCGLPEPEHARAAALQAAADGLRQQRGLQVNGYFATDRTTVNSENDYGAYVELSWDLLREGYLDYRDRAEATSVQARLARLRGDLAMQRRALRCARDRVHGRFASIRSRLLTLKLDLMEPVYRIERRAYFKGWSQLDDLLVSEADLVLLRSELAQLHAGPSLQRQAMEVPAFNPPILDIDMAGLAEAIQADRRQDRLQALEEELARLARDEPRNRVRLFVRHQLDGVGQDSLSAGVRVSVPLGQFRDRRDEQLGRRLEGIDAEYRVEQWERVTRARSAYLDVREQLERVIRQHYRYARAYERARRSLAEHELTPQHADVALAATRMRDLLDAAIEAADAKEVLYRRLIEVFNDAQLQFQPGLVRVVQLPDIKDRRRSGTRLLYAWSKGFNRTPNAVLLDFLRTKGVDHLALSAGTRTDRNKLNDFLGRAQQHDITVEIVQGEPEWVLPANQDRAVARIRRAADLTGAVNLDIEPHTLPGFKSRRGPLLEDYLSLIDRVRSQIDRGVRLTVAVPVHWPAEIYRRLAAKVDGVYLMAYGEPEADRLLARLQPALGALATTQTCVVLRARDFEDEWQMQQVMDRLRQAGITRFGIHDLDGYIALSAEAS